MKNIIAALLAIGFVLYSLIAVLSIERNQDSAELAPGQQPRENFGARTPCCLPTVSYYPYR